MKNSAVRDMMDAIRETTPKESGYDTVAEVRRVEDGTAWVHIPGGVDETPVSLTIDAKAGDQVQVRVGGGSAWLVGNASAPPTDDYIANIARGEASAANQRASTAMESAEEARAAADDAIASAATAAAAASAAQTSANEAKTSATNASEYASRALGNLSTVQSVAETLTWITQHGTMTLTSDTEPDPTHVYFVRDANGDYEVGSYKYSIVSEPDADDMSTYYELSIDESLNNYVGTHLAVTAEGLWVLPAATNTYKVLIATGNGTQYTTAGMYVIDETGATIAFYGSAVQIGDASKSHLFVDYRSLQLLDKQGVAYFDVRDLRGLDGKATITDVFRGTGSTYAFLLSLLANNTDYTVNVSDGSGGTITKSTTSVSFSSAPSNGATITVVYTTESQYAKSLTYGTRSNGSPVGGLSATFGSNNSAGTFAMAQGLYCHAGGIYAFASGDHAEAPGMVGHAEGYHTEAEGAYSHSQNVGTIAAGYGQTALGSYNVRTASMTYCLIIGNGTADNARSDALHITPGGEIHLDLNPSGASLASDRALDAALYSAITALGWASEVIV